MQRFFIHNVNFIHTQDMMCMVEDIIVLIQWLASGSGM